MTLRDTPLDAEPSEAAHPLSPDLPFRVEAGPGAGKTHWLVGHIRHTLAHGQRLLGNPRARIACITYTYAGTETVRQRLGPDADRLWVSTIHSFLYHHLVRPYAHLLGIEGFDTSLLHGHDVVRPRSEDGQQWLRDLGLSDTLWHTELALRKNLTDHLIWKQLADGTWRVAFSRSANWQGVRGKNPSATYGRPEALLAYKTRLWNRGRIDHGDVVHLAHRLASEHDGLIEALTHRFPYVFLDEYQDTTPRQADVVDALARAGAVVGVIGDLNQSIFSFAGADPASFKRFNPPGVQRHALSDNHRSTPSIVRVLNAYRRDDVIVQQSARAQPPGDAELPVPTVLVGPILQGYTCAAGLLPGGSVLHAIGRSHEDVNALLRAIHGSVSVASPWDDMMKANSQEGRFLEALCRGVRLVGAGRRRDAIHAFDDLFRSGGGVVEPLQSTGDPLTPVRRRAVAALMLVAGEETPRDADARAALTRVSEALNHASCGVALTISNTRGASARAVALARPFSDYLDTVELDAPVGVVRTIHRFKGDEADAVLVVASAALRERLIAPRSNDDDTRLLYVALSRARSHLFVSVPRLSAAECETLEAKGFKVVLTAGTTLEESLGVESTTSRAGHASGPERTLPVKPKSPAKSDSPPRAGPPDLFSSLLG